MWAFNSVRGYRRAWLGRDVLRRADPAPRTVPACASVRAAVGAVADGSPKEVSA